MLEELTLVRMASAMARHAGARHRVIAENVANADTPGYRARELRGFAEYVNESFTPRATRVGHEGGDGLTRAAFRQEVVEDLTAQPTANGNSVSLEAEMVKAVGAQGEHALASLLYRKAHDIMRLGLGKMR